jgi:hypothetical protein
MFGCYRGQVAVAVTAFGYSHAAVFVALALAASAVAAEEDSTASPENFLTAQSGTPRQPLLELTSSEVPRFDSGDSRRASRTNLTLFPAGRSAVGVSLGVTTSGGPALGAYVPGGPMLDLGLQWRYEMDGAYRLDVTAWRRVGNVDAIALIQSRDPNFGARVEMGFASGKQTSGKAFVADRGFVGMQLDGGARVTVKRSGGRPMLYYRNTF